MATPNAFWGFSTRTMRGIRASSDAPFLAVRRERRGLSAGVKPGSGTPMTYFRICPKLDTTILSIRHEPIVLSVAFACHVSQSCTVEDSDQTALIADQPQALQLNGGFRNAGAPSAQHHREKFVGQGHRI